MANKTKGTVKFYNGEKGVFVHASQLDGFGSTLQEGQLVMFETVQGKKGMEAHNLEMA